jgi:hypothetical protein
MDLKTLVDTPPWEWPRNAGKIIHKILTDSRANEADRLIAADLAGEFVVMSDELAHALLTLVRNADEPEQLRAKAAISLGPILEHVDTDGFEDPDEVFIAEPTFRNIQDSFHELYFDNSTPKEVRRRILEASVRAPESWHKKAIATAYSTGDKDWMLTAVFSMRWVAGFDIQILEALKSPDPEIHYQAVHAAGEWGVDAAWSHIFALVSDVGTPKPLLLAAIGAAAGIRPRDAAEVLADLTDSEDEEIAEAADEAIAIAGPGYDEAEDEEWIN